MRVNSLPAIAIFVTVLDQMIAEVFVRLGDSIQSWQSVVILQRNSYQQEAQSVQ